MSGCIEKRMGEELETLYIDNSLEDCCCKEWGSSWWDQLSQGKLCFLK